MTKVSDIRWLAGLLEGEGHFAYNSRTPRIQLKMTDRDVVARAARVLGVKLRRRTKRTVTGKVLWHATICGCRAIGWMFMLWPELGSRRRRRIKSVIKLWKRVPVRTQVQWYRRRRAEAA